MFSSCVYFATNAAARELSKLWDREFAALKLTAAQAYMLILVIREPTLPMNEIGLQMNLEASTVTRALKGLEKKKLISRRQDAGDQRIVRWAATTSGKNLESKITQISRRINQALRKDRDVKILDNLAASSVKFLKSVRGDA